jgi:hypothetical protein
VIGCFLTRPVSRRKLDGACVSGVDLAVGFARNVISRPQQDELGHPPQHRASSSSSSSSARDGSGGRHKRHGRRRPAGSSAVVPARQSAPAPFRTPVPAFPAPQFPVSNQSSPAFYPAAPAFPHDGSVFMLPNPMMMYLNASQHAQAFPFSQQHVAAPPPVHAGMVSSVSPMVRAKPGRGHPPAVPLCLF